MPGDDDELLGLVEAAILRPGRHLTPRELWSMVEVPEELAKDLWRAMGFASIPDDEPAATEADAEALGRAARLLRAGLVSEDRLRHQTRVMSQALATVARAHAEGPIGEALAGPGVAGADDRPLPDPGLLEDLDALLLYIYRRHLLAALEHRLVTSGGEAADRVEVVGFADLTHFTATASSLTEEQLTVVVDDFTALAADLVAGAGGRVVKLIGDEVMFTVGDPAAAAGVLLGLLDAAAAREAIPEVHAGAALGPVLSHHGDCFGPTVNLASRLTDVARAGSVLVDPALADALADDDRWYLRRFHLRHLKGIGSLDVAALRRSRD